jgi:hypothetical protein
MRPAWGECTACLGLSADDQRKRGSGWNALTAFPAFVNYLCV